MSKKGHKKGLGMMAEDDIRGEDIIQNGKEQASNQKSMGYVASMDLQSEKPQGRPYTWMHVGGTRLKKYVTEQDMRHLSPDQIHYERAITAADAKKLPDDFEMPPIE
jgi:hypothetical protein